MKRSILMPIMITVLLLQLGVWVVLHNLVINTAITLEDLNTQANRQEKNIAQLNIEIAKATSLKTLAKKSQDIQLKPISEIINLDNSPLALVQKPVLNQSKEP